jgi:hypothetical protein
MTTANGLETWEHARRYHAAGLSIIPIARDGSKQPIVKWAKYRTTRATEQQLDAWFHHHEPPGLAVIGGQVSGGAEFLDFDVDAFRTFAEWFALVQEESADLAKRLAVNRTPRPGVHVGYRCATTAGNTELAKRPRPGSDPVVLIETRGEGGYILLPGTPPECHASGQLYEHFRGPTFDALPLITPQERGLLWKCAAVLDELGAPEEQFVKAQPAEGPRPSDRVGDDFNARAQWADILTGWVPVRQSERKTFWRRPGKTEPGWSATTGCVSKSGNELFCVFSSNAAPFLGAANGKPCTTYTKFAAYTLLHHQGDFGAATMALAARGFGKPLAGEPKNESPLEPGEFELIDSKTFDAMDCRLHWLVEGIAVVDQPGVFGGPKKTLKTTLGVDFAVSVSLGEKFLGEFLAPERRRIAMLSGESGKAALQSIARRVAQSKGRTLAECDIRWGFRLPQLASDVQLDLTRRQLEKHAIRVLLLDPLYLCLLAGDAALKLSAANMFQTGPLLFKIAAACQSVGCALWLFHHFKLTREDRYGQPQLEDLAFSGIQEFARQWILLGRRSAYDEDDPEGKQELWLNAGGSAGHSLARAVDCFEGQIDNNFAGRFWKATVLTTKDARTAAADSREIQRGRQKDAQDYADNAKILDVLDKHDGMQYGISFTQLRGFAELSTDRTRRACSRLIEAGTIEELKTSVLAGQGARLSATCYCRRRQKRNTGDNTGIPGVPGVEQRNTGNTGDNTGIPGVRPGVEHRGTHTHP